MSVEDKLYPFLRLYEAAPQPMKTIVGSAYRALPRKWRYGAAYERFLSEACEAETWDPAAIERYQIAALRESLMAAGKARLYSRRFAEAGVDPAKFDSIEQLAAYPQLTKSDLLAHRDELVNPQAPANQALYITTGGSSGVPVGFYLQRGVSRAKEQAYFDTLWARRGYRPGERVAVVRGWVTSSNAGGKISYYDATRDWLILSSYHLTIERLPEYIDELRRFRPRHLHAYPSAALLLARGLEQTGARLGLELGSVLCGSEKLSAPSQAYLERILGAPVFHWYGHSERVLLAGQARRSNHLYFSPTYGYVEFGPADEQGNQEIIGTSFHNEVMPLIRYRTGDFARFPDHAERELPMLEIEAVVGREYEYLLSGTGRQISLTAINMHDGIFDGLIAVQFYQRSPGAVEFRYQPGMHWNESAVEAMRAGLQRKLGDDFTLVLRQVSEVEKTKAGKHMWLVTEPSCDS